MQTKPNSRPARGRTGHPTIATIAADLGLSRSTVTHVLNGRGGEQRIRRETQERVLQVAREMGYRANASARAVRAGRFGSVALIQSELGQYLPPELLSGLTSAIAARDLHLVLTAVPNVDATDEGYVANTMHELSVDGVFVNRHAGTPPPFLQRIHQLRIPAIFLNSRQELDSVYPDDLAGGQIAAEYLLRLGHERIAYVDTGFRCRPHYSVPDRRAGYERAMEEAGRAAWTHSLPEQWRDPVRPGVDRRVDAAVDLLRHSGRPTAVVAYEMTEAMAVVRAAHLLRLRIPQDLSLIQFHNNLDARYFIPVHTVSNMMREVGGAAVGMLLEKIERPQEALPSKVIAERLLEGATCARNASRP